jgi:hypothetical protein
VEIDRERKRLFSYIHYTYIHTFIHVQYTDLIASGSCDGFVRLWQCGEDHKTLREIGKILVKGTACMYENTHNMHVYMGIGHVQDHKTLREIGKVPAKGYKYIQRACINGYRSCTRPRDFT